MVSMKVFILLVNLVVPLDQSVHVRASDPHKYYETMGACQAAGDQWVYLVLDEKPKGNSKEDQKASYSCRQQTILVPKG